MNSKSIWIIWLVLCIHSGVAFGQNEKVIGLKADSLKARQVDGRTVFDLVRPVLTQDDSILSSNFGVDEGNGYVRFWGNVQIFEVEDTLRADRIRYHRDTKVGVAEGNVFMTDGTAQLRAPSATHYSKEDRTEFNSGVSYSDSLGTLTAERATYYSEFNTAHFYDQVTFKQDDVSVFADSLQYAREENISEAWGRVFIDQRTDTTSTQLLSDYLYRNAAIDSMSVIGHTRLVSIDLIKSDTLFVSSNRMVLVEDQDFDTVTASDSVLVSSPNYSLRGDSLRTQNWDGGRRESRIFGSPLAWLEETQVSADSLFFKTASAGPDSLLGFGAVFVASRDSVSGRIQQLNGRRLTALMQSDSLRSLILEENAEALFYTRERSEDPLTAVRASSDGVVFHFEGGEPSEVRFYQDVEATYYAENMLEQLANLSGYRWSPELMPDRALLSSLFWAEVQSRRRSEE